MSSTKQGALLMLMFKLTFLYGVTSEIGMTDHAHFEIPLKKKKIYLPLI